MSSSQPVASSSKHRKASKHSKQGKHSSSKNDASPFEFRRAYMRLSIPPVFAGDLARGAGEMLESLVMRYVPQLDGVLLAFSELAFTDRTAEIINDCPFGVCEVEFNAVIWAPKVGQRLSGTHSLSSPSHLSLLFGKTFNISIPLQHIPDDIYEFDYSAGDAQSADESDDDDSDAGEDNHVHEVGRWRDRRTGKLVGQDDGDKLKFTVIGLHVSNQMLSLTGSLLKDPSKPKRIATPAIQSARDSVSASPEPEGSTAIAALAGAIPAVDEEVARAEKRQRKEDKKQKRREKEERKLAKLQSAGAALLVTAEPDLKVEDASAAPVAPAPEIAPGGAAGADKKKKRKAGEDGETGKKAKKRKEAA